MNARDQRIWDSAFAAAWVQECYVFESRSGRNLGQASLTYITEHAEDIAQKCLENFRLMNAARVKK